MGSDKPASVSRETFDFVNYINTYIPVVGLDVYPNGASVVRRARSKQARPHAGGGNRNKIMELSVASRKRMAFTAIATTVEFHSMITLTYGNYYPNTGSEVKGHLNSVLGWVRRYTDSPYFWFLEFQRRGAPHFHILTSLVDPRPYDRHNLAQAWLSAQGLDCRTMVPAVRLPRTDGWPSSSFTRSVEEVEKMRSVLHHERTWESIRVKDGARKYCLKYAMKPTQKTVPVEYEDVGRFWGCSRAILDNIRPIEQWDLDEATLRQILTDAGNWGADQPLLPKYLFGVDSPAPENIDDVGPEIDNIESVE